MHGNSWRLEPVAHRRSRGLFPFLATTILLAGLTACGGGGGGGNTAGAGNVNPVPDQVTWLTQHGKPLSGVDPNASDAELAFLGGMVGSAKAVGLGEATHGTSEFFQMKHRLLRYLVEHQGFRAFGIEAQMGRCIALNRYIQTGEGDPAKLVSDMGFWTWRNTEVLDMVNWMCAYNALPSHTEKLEYFGFDMQDGGSEMDHVLEYIHAVDPAAEGTIRSAYAPFRPYTFDAPTAPYYSSASPEVQQQCREGVEFVRQWLVDHRTTYTATSGVDAYEWALRLAVVATQTEACLRYDAPSDSMAYFQLRDAAMAENASWYLQHRRPGIKAVLWAHNGHINTAQVPAYAGYGTPFGGHLRSRLGVDYLSLGFLCYQGSALAIPLNADGSYGNLQANPLSTQSQATAYESVFHRTGWTTALLDLREIKGSSAPGAAWWTASHTTREFGAVWSSSAGFGVTDNLLSDRFDLVVYVLNSSPAHNYPKPAAGQSRSAPEAGNTTSPSTRGAMPHPWREVLRDAGF